MVTKRAIVKSNDINRTSYKREHKKHALCGAINLYAKYIFPLQNVNIISIFMCKHVINTIKHYRLSPPPQKKKKRRIGILASITFKIRNQSKYALGLWNYN